MELLQRVELTMENDEVLVIPGDMVRILDISQVWQRRDILPNGEESTATTFEQSQICISAAAAIPYPTACGISSMNMLERIALFCDITWIDIFYDGDDEPQSFFAPYEDGQPTAMGTPNRLMHTDFDENGNLWVWILGDETAPVQQE